MPEEQFVTVAEAAQSLGLSERQARRRAAILEADGRTRTDGRTRLVTVADMKDVRPDIDRKKAFPSTSTVKVSKRTDMSDDRTDGRTDIEDPADGRTDGHFTRTDGHVREAKAVDQSELVEQLRSEVASLREALATSQRLTDQAQQLQLMTERRAAALEAEVEKLKAIEAMPTDTATMQTETAQGAQNRDHGGDTVPATPMEPPTADTAQNGQKRGFWRRVIDSLGG